LTAEDAPPLSWWIDHRGGIEGAFAALLADPRFPQAVRAFVVNMRVVAAGDAELDSIFKDIGRYMVAQCVLYLHETGGATLPRLMAIEVTRAFISVGRARAVLRQLCHFDFLEAVPPERRGIPVQYVPTGRFLAAWRVHLRAVLEATQIIEPSVGRVLDRLDEPAVFGAFCKNHTEVGFREVRATHQTLAYVDVFLHRYAGTQILWDLLSIEDADDLAALRPVRVSINGVALRYNVSRTHVRRLLNAGVAGGLVRSMGDGAFMLEEAGLAAAKFTQATQFFVFITTIQRTAADMAVC
jgi:hypothetical protein